MTSYPSCAHTEPNLRDCEARLVLIFNHQVTPGRNAAMRAGWNDGAWGRPHCEVALAQTMWYERGYAGGLVFRHKEQCDTARRAVVSGAVRRVNPAA